jgi:hypothetical protein
MTTDQKTRLKMLMRKKPHPFITEQIRRALFQKTEDEDEMLD